MKVRSVRRHLAVLFAVVMSASLLAPPAAAFADAPIPGSHAVPVVAFTGSAEPWATASIPDGSIDDPNAQIAYQWLRISGGSTTSILGATGESYLMTAADTASRIAVRATITDPSFDTLVLQSDSHATTVSVPALPVIQPSSGDFEVDSRLEVPDFGVEYEGAPYFSYGSSYQWLRNGQPIAGADTSLYLPVLADLGKRLSVRVTVQAINPMLLPFTFTTAETVALALGTQKPYDIPYVTMVGPIAPNTFFQLQANPYYEQTPGSTLTIKWYRDSTLVAPISKTSTHLYQLTAADAGHKIKVVVTMTRPGFRTLTQSSIARNYTWMVQTPGPVIVGDPAVGHDLSIASTVEFDREVGAYPDSRSGSEVVTWYRNGVAVPGFNLDVYPLTSADIGKSITVSVRVAEQGFLSQLARSAPTQVIRSGLFVGYGDPATVTQSGMVLTANSGISSSGVSYAYQWYRAGVPVPKATKKTYTLSSADWGKPVRVRIIATKTNFTTAVKYSAPVDYSVKQDAIPTVSGVAMRVGEVASIAGQSYVAGGAPIIPSGQAFQWYRNGVAIKGAVASTYPIAAADYNTRLSVRIVSSSPGYLPLVYTTARSAIVAKGVTTSTPTVTVSTVAGKLSAAVTAGSLVPASPVPAIAYQWLRDGAVIPGATHSTYLPTVADWGTQLSARLTLTRANFSAPTIVITSTPAGYSVHSAGNPAHIAGAGAGAVHVNDVASVVPATSYVDDNGATVSPDIAYQWLRGGVPIPGATGPSYRLAAADIGKLVSARVTASVLGLSPAVVITDAVGPGEPGIWPDGIHAVAFAKYGHGRLLSAALYDSSGNYLDPNQPTYAGWQTSTRTYQWYRQDATNPSAPWVKIVGATKQDYELSESADYNKNISVLASISMPGYPPLPPQQLADIDAGQNWSLVMTAPGSLSVADPKVGDWIVAQWPTYVDGITGDPHSINALTCDWQWYRGSTAIPRAWNQDYTAQQADVGKILSVTTHCTNFDRLQPPWTLKASSAVAPAP